MTFDRDEQYLHDVLQAGLPTAGADLWPAVAEALPAGQARQRRRTRAVRLAVCLGAPLLLAAGALLGRAEFTNLRENPRPSFAPENNTGYAIRYDQTAYELPEELMASLYAHYNGQRDANGMPAMRSRFGGVNPPSSGGPGGRGYDSWNEMAEATGLPLLQSELLDNSPAEDAIYLTPEEEDPVLPDNWDDLSMEEHNAFYEAYYDDLWRQAGARPVGFTVRWVSNGNPAYQPPSPSYMLMRRVNHVSGQMGNYLIELRADAALAYEHVPAGTTLSNHEVWFTQQSALTWENEEYTTDCGIVAVMPHCTSYQEPAYRDTYAFFTWDGIYYRLSALSLSGWEDGATADARAVLKEVLDSFTPAEKN